MGNGYEVGGDGYQSGAASPGFYRRHSMNRSSSSIFEDVEMAQDEVSRADYPLLPSPGANPLSRDSGTDMPFVTQALLRTCRRVPPHEHIRLSPPQEPRRLDDQLRFLPGLARRPGQGGAPG